jgi:predicted nucleic acid-binding protein
MRILVDTNAVLSAFQHTRADHQAVRQALERLVEGGWELCICSQIVYEFWAVATRPVAANGLGLEIAAAELDRLLAAYLLLPDPPDMLVRWRAFCIANRVRGGRSHDARVAALMLAAGAERILTQNNEDFAGWADVHPIVAADV